MQLLMRRRGRREKRQMYCDALLAFNDVDGGKQQRLQGRGARGWGKKEKRKQNAPIGDTSNGTLLELHDVTGQGPRLVRENVFHLYGKTKTEPLNIFS